MLLLLGCSSIGYYGENCSIPCPVNCLDGLCDTENGTCYRCLDGYSGPTCNKGYSQRDWFFFLVTIFETKPNVWYNV